MNKVIKSIPDGLEASYADELPTDLSEGTRNTDSIEIQSSTGQNYVMPSATETQAGLMSASDKSVLLNKATVAENKLELIAGVIRQDSKGSGWYIIGYGTHHATGITSVSVTDNGILQINYTPNAIKVGSLIVAQDESYAKYNISLGSSVGTTVAYVTGYMKLRMTISASTLSSTVEPFFEDYVSVTNDSATGIISVTHPITYSKNLAQVESVNIGTHDEGITWSVQNSTTTSFDLVPYAHAAEHYSWDGTTFVEYNDNLVDKPTFTIDTDGLVTMEFPVGNSPTQEFGIYNIIPRWSTLFPYDIRITFQNNKTLKFYYIDSNGGTIPKSSFNSSTKLYFTSTVKMRTKRIYGYINIIRDDVLLNFNSVYGAYANLWVFGAMGL